MTLGRQIFAALAVTLVTSAIVYLVCLVLPKTYESEQVLIFPAAAASSSNLASSFFNSSGGSGGDVPSYSMPGSMFYNIVIKYDLNTKYDLQYRILSIR